jgi:hypothetical protein
MRRKEVRTTKTKKLHAGAAFFMPARKSADSIDYIPGRKRTTQPPFI